MQTSDHKKDQESQ